MVYMSSHIWVFSIKSTVWKGWLVGGFSPRRPGSDPKTVHLGFVADKEGFGTDFSTGISVPPVSIIPPKQHKHNPTHFYAYDSKALCLHLVWPMHNFTVIHIQFVSNPVLSCYWEVAVQIETSFPSSVSSKWINMFTDYLSVRFVDFALGFYFWGFVRFSC